jgi:hypothetical protein
VVQIPETEGLFLVFILLQTVFFVTFYIFCLWHSNIYFFVQTNKELYFTHLSQVWGKIKDSKTEEDTCVFKSYPSLSYMFILLRTIHQNVYRRSRVMGNFILTTKSWRNASNVKVRAHTSNSQICCREQRGNIHQIYELF